MFQIPKAKRLEYEGLLSLSRIPGIPSQAREPEACHETISQPHAVHAIHVFYTKNANKRWTGAALQSSGAPSRELLALLMNARCAAE